MMHPRSSGSGCHAAIIIITCATMLILGCLGTSQNDTADDQLLGGMNSDVRGWVGSLAPAHCWSYEYSVAHLTMDDPRLDCGPTGWSALVRAQDDAGGNVSTSEELGQPATAPFSACSGNSVPQSPINIGMLHAMRGDSALRPMPACTSEASAVVARTSVFRPIRFISAQRKELFIVPAESGSRVCHTPVAVVHPIDGRSLHLLGVAVRSPSEHALGGSRRGAELQVHYGATFSDIEANVRCWDALATVSSDVVGNSTTGADGTVTERFDACAEAMMEATSLVVSILFDAGQQGSTRSSHTGMSELVRRLERSLGSDAPRPGVSNSALMTGPWPDLWPLNTGYATYVGTTTRPPCTASVRWVVHTSALRMGVGQYTALRSLMGMADGSARLTEYDRSAVSNGSSPDAVVVSSTWLSVEGNGRPTHGVTPEHQLQFYTPPLGPEDAWELPASVRRAAAGAERPAAWNIETQALQEYLGVLLAVAVVTTLCIAALLLHRVLMHVYGVERVIRHRKHEREEIMRQYVFAKARAGEEAAATAGKDGDANDDQGSARAAAAEGVAPLPGAVTDT